MIESRRLLYWPDLDATKLLNSEHKTIHAEQLAYLNLNHKLYDKTDSILDVPLSLCLYSYDPIKRLRCFTLFCVITRIAVSTARLKCT